MPARQLFVNPKADTALHIGEPIDLSQFEDINEAMTYVREKVEEGLKA
jgi:hypothetical protein